MLIGTVYYFIPFSVTLTMAGGHTVCTEQNLLVSVSGTRSPTELDGIWRGDEAV